MTTGPAGPNVTIYESCPALLRTGLVSACLLWWPHHKRQAFARCARLQDLGSVYTNAGLPASAHALPSWFPRPRNAETTRGGACMRGQAPSNSPKGSGSWFGTPPARGSQKAPRSSIPKSTFVETWARKGSMEQSVHRPLYKSDFRFCPSRQFRCR